MHVDTYVQVPHESGGSAIVVKCTWSNTGNTVQALSMDEDDDADFTFDSMDEEDEHEVDHGTDCGACTAMLPVDICSSCN